LVASPWATSGAADHINAGARSPPSPVAARRAYAGPRINRSTWPADKKPLKAGRSTVAIGERLGRLEVSQPGWCFPQHGDGGIGIAVLS